MTVPTPAKKRIYSFGGGEAEGSAELKPLLEKGAIPVDVRSENEFDENDKIPGAVRFPAPSALPS